MSNDRKPKKVKSRTSWERRRRRRVRGVLYTMLFCVLAVVLFFLYWSILCYEVVDLSEYVTFEYSGYNHKGAVEVNIDQDRVSELIRNLKDTYDERLVHAFKCEDRDYNDFYNSLQVSTIVPDNLSNGSQFIYTVQYDEKLAKKIRLSVKNNKKTVTVSGLVTATVLKMDDIFRDVSVTFEGISPKITATLENRSEHPFIKNIVFNILEPKEFYSAGDEVKVRAYYSEAECIDKHFVIEVPTEECIRSYVVNGEGEYVQSASDLPQEIIDEAVSKAKQAFSVDAALEFGLRVYSEANLTYVIDPVTKKYTFRWDSYSPLSAYFKVPRSDIAGENGKTYNDLDIIFKFVMVQNGGQKCNGMAAVRFSNILKNADGTYSYDFSSPKIISATHYESRIKKNVITNYEKDYTVEKVK